MKNFTHKLAAAMTVGATILMGGDANAATNLNSLTDNIAGASGGLSKMTSMVAYLCGGGLAVTGVVKLKDHIDNPQTPLKAGLARLGTGAALLSIPYMTTVMQGTISDGDTSSVSTSDTVLDTNFGSDFGSN